MARIVLGIGAPHTPFFPGIAKAQGNASRMVGLFNRLRSEFDLAAPDLILMFTTDHFVGFFLDNMPTLACHSFLRLEIRPVP